MTIVQNYIVHGSNKNNTTNAKWKCEFKIYNRKKNICLTMTQDNIDTDKVEVPATNQSRTDKLAQGAQTQLVKCDDWELTWTTEGIQSQTHRLNPSVQQARTNIAHYTSIRTEHCLTRYLLFITDIILYWWKQKHQHVLVECVEVYILSFSNSFIFQYFIWPLSKFIFCCFIIKI